tara:strand:- start:402 stop:1334 length:933 start_codon:yes stop_codon:yes gene_type:complete
LVKSVRKRAMIPNDTDTYTDDDILEIANEEMDVSILPVLLSLHEEHLVTHIDIEVDSETTRYKIPYRSIANKLREVSLVDSAGGVYELSRISLEELADYRSGYTSYNRNNIFYVEGDEIVLLRSNLQSYDFLRMYFYARPNVIVPEDGCAVIDVIDYDTGTIVVKNFPSSFSSTPEMDFVGNKTPNKLIGYDIQPTSVDVNANTIMFDPDDLPENIEAGDYLCLKETTPVPQIPTEMHPVLAQVSAIFILEAMGDTEGLANAEKKLRKMTEGTMSIIDDRVEGAPQKINQRHSTLMQSANGGWNRRNRRF